jgi:hypothetical protein
MRVRNAVRRIGRRVRNTFRRRQRAGVYAPATPGHQSRGLAAALSGVVGSSLIWCSCGRLLAPIVFSDGEHAAEIIALASRGVGGFGLLHSDAVPRRCVGRKP